MLSLSIPLESLRLRQTTTYATCWKIVRTDGVTLYLTDNNCILAFEGHNYTPLGGFSSSAEQHEEGFEGQNLEVQGILTSTAITHNDLRAGRYRNAAVTEYLVDWRHPWVGALATYKYWISEVRYTGEQWVAQLAGLPRRLQHKVGNVYTRPCRYALGDADCQIVLATTDKPVNTLFTTDKPWFYFYDESLPSGSSAVYGITGVRMTAKCKDWGVGAPEFISLGREGYVKTKELIISGITFPIDDDCSFNIVVHDQGSPICGSFTFGMFTGSEVWAILTRNAGTGNFDVCRSGVAVVNTAIDVVDGIDIKLTCVEDGGVNDLRMYYRPHLTGGAWTLFDTTLGGTLLEGWLCFALAKAGWMALGHDHVTDIEMLDFYQDLTRTPGTVSDVTSAGYDARRIFGVTGINFDTDYANYGKITWLTGNNTGLTMEIKDWELNLDGISSFGKVTLQLKMPFTIAVGDTFTMTAGCTKLKPICKTKFNNVVNFGGFPHIPGTDKMLWTPGSKA